MLPKDCWIDNSSIASEGTIANSVQSEGKIVSSLLSEGRLPILSMKTVSNYPIEPETLGLSLLKITIMAVLCSLRKFTGLVPSS